MTSPSASLSVLRNRGFRTIWISGLVSQIGGWMQSLGAAWLMTTLDRSPFMVGLVFAVQMMPPIFLAPFAGALTDMFERRKFLIVVMVWQLAITLILTVLTFFDWITPGLLVTLVLLVGFGSACQVPALLSLTQDMVPRESMVGAITMNSVSVNVSRAIGPAVAGILVGYTSEAAAFLVNAACYIPFLFTILRIVPPNDFTASSSSEGLTSTMLGGFRYARRAKRFQAVLVRSFVYFFAGSVNASLLPVVARQELKVGPDALGGFLTLIGFGAVVTVFLIAPYANRHFHRDQIVLFVSLFLAACLLGLGWTHNIVLFCLMLVIYGGLWTTAMVELQVAAQMVLPAWVRGRGLSLAAMSSSAGIVGGSLTWSYLAVHVSIPATFSIATAALVATAFLTYRFKISGNEPEEV